MHQNITCLKTVCLPLTKRRHFSSVIWRYFPYMPTQSLQLQEFRNCPKCSLKVSWMCQQLCGEGSCSKPRAQCLPQTPLASTEPAVTAPDLWQGVNCGLGGLCNDGKKSVGGQKGRAVCFRDTVPSADHWANRILVAFSLWYLLRTSVTGFENLSFSSQLGVFVGFFPLFIQCLLEESLWKQDVFFFRALFGRSEMW